MILLFVLGWLLCALLAAGTCVAYFQNEYKEISDRHSYHEDLGLGIGLGLLFGPMAAFATMFLSGFWTYGWSLKSYKTKKIESVIK